MEASRAALFARASAGWKVPLAGRAEGPTGDGGGWGKESAEAAGAPEPAAAAAAAAAAEGAAAR